MSDTKYLQVLNSRSKLKSDLSGTILRQLEVTSLHVVV